MLDSGNLELIKYFVEYTNLITEKVYISKRNDQGFSIIESIDLIDYVSKSKNSEMIAYLADKFHLPLYIDLELIDIS